MKSSYQSRGEAASESEEKFAKAFRCSPNAFTLSTLKEDTFLDVNLAFELVTGYTRDEAVGRKVSDLAIWEDYSERAKLAEKIVRGEPVRNVECRFRKKSGEIFIGLLSAELVQLNGETCVFANVVDVTEWKRSQQELNASLRKASIYLEQTLFGVIEWDLDRRVAEWNPAAEIIFGYSRQEALGRHAMELIVPAGEVSATFRSLLDQSGGRLSINENLRKDGQTIACEWFNNPLIAEDGRVTGILSLVHDVTTRIQGEKKLRDLSGRLINAQEQERRRIARELHDSVNQRLALVAFGIEELQKRIPLPAAEGGDLFRKLLNDIIEISGDIQALSHELHSSKLDYLGLVPAIRGLCREVRDRHHVDVQFTHHGVPGSLPHDLALALFRVTQEALHNALKYSGVHIFKVVLNGSRRGIQLTISDNGAGFDVDCAMKGEGLGLISMRERIQPLGGLFSIQSKPQQGTKVIIRVPLPASEHEGSRVRAVS